MEREAPNIEQVREFLLSYRLCVEMLDLRKYERKRIGDGELPACCEDILAGDETYWRIRLHEVNALVGNMKNSREKLILYYHYIRGLSVERAANLLGVSRRTGYRLHQKGLQIAARLYRQG